MPEIEFTIDTETGKCDTRINGIHGPACEQTARQLKQVLGAPTTDRKTAEFHVKPQENGEWDQMNNELVFVLEPDVGRVTVDISQAPTRAVDDLARDLGTRVNINCAKPAENRQRNLPVLQRQFASPDQSELDEFSIWLYRLYHHSTVDGPGRRSVVQVSGCSIRCPQCFVPRTHFRDSGVLVPITSIVGEIVAKRDVHDGVTILGGEPFDQPGPVAELVSRLKLHDLHITIYSGYTLEVLIQRKTPSIDYKLTHIDLLIDGPFVSSMSAGASEYRGSRNQRLIGHPGQRK